MSVTPCPVTASAKDLQAFSIRASQRSREACREHPPPLLLHSFYKELGSRLRGLGPAPTAPQGTALANLTKPLKGRRVGRVLHSAHTMLALMVTCKMSRLASFSMVITQSKMLGYPNIISRFPQLISARNAAMACTSESPEVAQKLKRVK